MYLGGSYVTNKRTCLLSMQIIKVQKILKNLWEKICSGIICRWCSRMHSATLTHSFSVHLFSTPWKYQKTLRFSDVFLEQRKGALRTNRLTKIFFAGGYFPYSCSKHLENLYLKWQHFRLELYQFLTKTPRSQTIYFISWTFWAYTKVVLHHTCINTRIPLIQHSHLNCLWCSFFLSLISTYLLKES